MPDFLIVIYKSKNIKLLVLTHSVCPCKNYGLKCFQMLQTCYSQLQSYNANGHPTYAWLPYTNMGRCLSRGVNHCKYTCMAYKHMGDTIIVKGVNKV